MVKPVYSLQDRIMIEKKYYGSYLLLLVLICVSSAWNASF